MKLGDRIRVTERGKKEKFINTGVISKAFKDKIIIQFENYRECFNIAAFVDQDKIKFERKVNGEYQQIVIKNSFDLRVV